VVQDAKIPGLRRGECLLDTMIARNDNRIGSAHEVGDLLLAVILSLQTRFPSLIPRNERGIAKELTISKLS